MSYSRARRLTSRFCRVIADCRAEIGKDRNERERRQREGRRQEREHELNERVKVHWQRDDAATVALPRLLEGTRREREGYVRRRQGAVECCSG